MHNHEQQTDNNMIYNIIQQLKAQVSIEQVVDALGLRKKLSLSQNGNSLQGDCVTGHASQNHKCFSINVDENYFKCFNCNIAGDIIELVQQSEEYGKFEAIKFLVSTFIPDLLPQIEEMGNNMTEETRSLYQRSALYQAIYREGKRLLLEPVGTQVLEYLTKDRGYNRTLIETTDFIYWDWKESIQEFLLKKFPDKIKQIKELPLVGAGGDQFRLAIPFKDRNGVITGFLKRAHVKDGFTGGVRWDSTPGTQKSDIFGLNKIRNTDTVVIVEGYPDATYFPALGLTNIVALGQAAISKKYFEGLKAKNINKIILALDNDDTGKSNTEKICKELVDSDFRVFVIDPELYGPYKDPDEYVKAKGIESFKSLLSESYSAGEWYVPKILTKYPTSTPIGLSNALTEALEFADALSSPTECSRVIEQIQKGLALTPEILQLEFQKVKERQSKNRLKKNLSNLNSNVRKLLDDGKDDEATRLLVEKPVEYLSEFSARKIIPEQSTADYLQFKKERDGNRQPNQRLGYELRRFSEIDRVLNGVQQGLYIIGAYPNVGKTALMSSLCIDLLESNDDVSVLFFTMDDSRDTIINRFLAGKTDVEINSVQVKQNDPLTQANLNASYDWLQKLASEGRFDVKEINEALTMDSVEHTIRMHAHRENLIVFVDGVYNVPMDGRFSSLREENIERANRIKQLVKFFNIPVIVSAELRKKASDEGKNKAPTMHDLMESGKYGYNADVVWLIYPQDESSYRYQSQPIINMAFEKNKLSSYRQTINLSFHRSHSIFKPDPLSSLIGPTNIVLQSSSSGKEGE